MELMNKEKKNHVSNTHIYIYIYKSYIDTINLNLITFLITYDGSRLPIVFIYCSIAPL